MPKGFPLTDDDKLRICELLEKGDSPNEVAKAMQLSEKTIYRIRKEFYGKDIRSMDTIIAGDKFNGQLKATGPGHFVGTCRIGNGKYKTRHFNVPNSKQAIEAWENWKFLFTNDKAEQPKKETYVATYDSKDSQILQVNMPINQNDTVKNLYILAIGNPQLAGWFADEAKAQQAMEAANKALEFAGVDIRYSVVEVERQN